jgi:hypothetical protein
VFLDFCSGALSLPCISRFENGRDIQVMVVRGERPRSEKRELSEPSSFGPFSYIYPPAYLQSFVMVHRSTPHPCYFERWLVAYLRYAVGRLTTLSPTYFRSVLIWKSRNVHFSGCYCCQRACCCHSSPRKEQPPYSIVSREKEPRRFSKFGEGRGIRMSVLDLEK